MATKTRNYRLTKPEGTDLVDIEDLNGNFDIIDTQLKTNADAARGKQDALTFDEAPTAGSRNPVRSGGVHTALGRKQDTLTFDENPKSGSSNPVKSGGIYSALQGKQDTLSFDEAPVSGSRKPVRSGGIYTAMANKQDKLTFDSAPVRNSTKPVYSGGVYSALQGKQDDLTQVPTVSSLRETDYLFIERSGTIYKILASKVITPSGDDGDNIETEDGNALLTESGDELLADI